MSQQAEEPRTVGEEAQPEQEHRATAHPIATAVDSLIHRARDTKVAVRQFLPAAIKIQKTRYKRIRKTLNDNVGLLEDPDTHTRVLAQKEIQGALVQFHRLHRSRVPEALETGLFLGLFSAFDAFTGDLLKGLYARKPGLFGSLNKSLSFADVLEAPSIEALKLQVLEDNIESLRRKSYVDQFATIGQRFDVKLTAFDRWPDFVECSQRRNLLTHCDGIVTDQYLSVCREAGLDASRLPKGGSQVKLGAKYFFTTCELVMEVGIKLGHTLWRKALPEELEEADEHLMEKLFEALENGVWSRARVIGEFAFNQKELSTDFGRKIVTVNYAQALKRDGAVEEAKQILDDVDWSAAANEFKLAKAVLLEDYQEASALMRKIGPQGELISEATFHTWPLFIEFRATDEFAATYLDVFGHPYASMLREEVEQASKKAADGPPVDEEAGTWSSKALDRIGPR